MILEHQNGPGHLAPPRRRKWITDFSSAAEIPI